MNDLFMYIFVQISHIRTYYIKYDTTVRASEEIRHFSLTSFVIRIKLCRIGLNILNLSKGLCGNKIRGSGRKRFHI